MSDDVKKLYRSKKNRMLGGVCSGLGNYFRLDPTIVRLIYIVLTFLLFPPTMLIVYLLLWLLIPAEPEAAVPPAEQVVDVDVK